MTDAVISEIIHEAAAKRGIDPDKITRPCRTRRVFWARVEVARRLDALGYSAYRIGRTLNHDHTTILFYLGRGKKQPTEERKPVWRTPIIRHVCFLKPPPQARRRYYLIPYAGAYMPEYEWKERRA